MLENAVNKPKCFWLERLAMSAVGETALSFGYSKIGYRLKGTAIN